MTDNNTQWRAVLSELDITASEAAGPAGAAGDWHQLVAAFGTRAFLRVLTDGTNLSIECAPPGDATAARGVLGAAGWTVDGEDTPFVAHREFPAAVETMKTTWLAIARLADAVRADDANAFASAVEPVVAASADSPQDEPKQADKAQASEPQSAPAFEDIGAGEPASEQPAQTVAFLYAVQRSKDGVDAVIGLPEALDARDFDALERRLVGNLRGKLDVDVKVVSAHELKLDLPQTPATRVGLSVTTLAGLHPDDAAHEVSAYFENLAGLARAGIDPLVFLGARDSKRNTGAFEAIGGPEEATPSGGGTMLVDDDPEPDPAAPQHDHAEPEQDAVVFDSADLIEPDAPLRSGRFDDDRLNRPDANTALVDVVLRHPGYSDRSIGQVLSILLSTDYASCLEIAERAPTVIAWGVARDRALTMKTVVEGAGGRVLLVEPGTFHED